MHSVLIEPTFEAWRVQVRSLLVAGTHPDDVLWCEYGAEAGLFAANDPLAPTSGPAPNVSAAFLDIARTVAAHTDPQRWAALYRVVWRLTRGGEGHLLSIPTDPDVRTVQELRKAVGRDIHKMHAFVRFRLVGTDDATSREQFVAWFEPDHRIVRLAAPFFQKRFAGMDWAILTPHECVHWDGTSLHFTPGVPRSATPGEDALDELWRTYFRSAFNPARLNVKAMQAEMPKKYWKNLPEAKLIPELIAGSGNRLARMLVADEHPEK